MEQDYVICKLLFVKYISSAKKYFVFLRNADFLCSLALPRLSVHYGEERLRLQQRSAAGGGPHLHLLHLRQQDPGDRKGDALRLSPKGADSP